MLKMVAGGTGHHTGNDYQRKHPETFTYSRTRTFYRVDEATDTEEWFFMDEYDDIELFHKAAELWTGDPATNHPMAEEVLTKNHPKWASLLVSGTTFPPDQRLFTELEELRLEFEPWSRRAAALKRDADEWWQLEALEANE